MKKNLASLNHAFASGSAGALSASLLLWWMGVSGLNRFLDVSLRPEFVFSWIGPRIFWGGILGFLLLIPFSKISWWQKGLLLSLVPSTLEFFLVYPRAGAGNLGLRLGLFTPLILLSVNAAGSVFAAFWGKKTGDL